MRIAIVNADGIVTNIIEAPMIYADYQKPCYDWTELREAYTDVEPAEHVKERYSSTAISALKSLLAQTDYEAIKYAEGVTTETQFANLKTAREAWRTAINTIQAATTVEEVTAVTYSTTIPAVD
jgi:hypothetical protein